MQRWIADLPVARRQPNLVFAAARWHGVPAPGPYAGLREALLADDGAIRTTILRRTTQTNEPGRLATLVPALHHAGLGSDGPLALIEVGASAGLCLYPDRWGYRWATPSGTVEVTPPDTVGHLVCDVTGDPRLPDTPLDVAWRAGIDLNPLDVRDEDAAAWLETLIWPEHTARRDVLSRAVRAARRDPPRIVAGDLLDELAPLVTEASEHGTVVVYHSAVLAYLPESGRRAFEGLMHELVADGTCHWVCNEDPAVHPDVAATAPPHAGTAPDAHLALGVDGRAVAWAHQHGRSLHWFGG